MNECSIFKKGLVIYNKVSKNNQIQPFRSNRKRFQTIITKLYTI